MSNSNHHLLYFNIVLLVQVLGIPSHMRGFHLLCDAIFLVTQSRHLQESVTKELYPKLAKHYHTDAACVEHAIRNAISFAHKKSVTPISLLFFAYGRPTNTDFIIAVADYLYSNHEDLLI